MSKIFFLMLSEYAGYVGAGGVAVKRLREKYPTRLNALSVIAPQVEDYDLAVTCIKNGLFTLVDLTTDVRLLTLLRQKCYLAEKVMLSVHGEAGKTDNGIVVGFGTTPSVSVSYQALGKLIKMLFVPNHAYNLTLIMCFGARSASWWEDHQILDNKHIDWTSGFAYKLYEQFYKDRNVRMTARTGEVAFNAFGASEVLTEASIMAGMQSEELAKEMQIQQLDTWYEHKVAAPTQPQEIYDYLKHVKAILGSGLGTERRKTLLQEQLKVYLPPSQENRKARDYIWYQIRLTELQESSSELRTKYGKMVYTRVDGAIHIYAKYPSPVRVHPP